MSLETPIANTLSIKSLNDLCRKLQIHEHELHFIIRTLPKLYIQDKREKGNGEFRILHKPIRKMVCLQKKIRRQLLEPIPLDPCVHGYRKGHSYITNAQAHQGNLYLAKLDIKGFFPSIHYTRVQRLFIRLGCSSDVAEMLTKLTTYEYCLPQGAPTSPDISNLILAEVDEILARVCKRKVLVYTRYSDDIAISGNWNFVDLVDGFIEVIERNGFLVSREKKEFLGPSERRTVTRRVINEKVNVVRDTVRQLRAEIHNCIMYGPSSQNIEDRSNYRAHLYGRARNVHQVNPDVGEQLLKMLAKVDSTHNWE